VALSRIACFEIRKQPSPLEHFSRAVSSANGQNEPFGLQFIRWLAKRGSLRYIS
jgi:hypothetical protein